MNPQQKLCCVTLRWAAGNVNTRVTGVFEAGKTYVYKYEALLLAGLLEKGSARAGLNISSKVSINAIDQNTYFIKVKIKILHKLQSFTFYMYTNWIKPYSYMKAWGTWAPGV